MTLRGRAGWLAWLCALAVGCAPARTHLLVLRETDPNIGGERREMFRIEVPLAAGERTRFAADGGGASYRGWARIDAAAEWHSLAIRIEKDAGPSGQPSFVLRTDVALEDGKEKSLGEFQPAEGKFVEWLATVSPLPSPP